MDESRDYHTKRNQTKINIGYHLYVESLKKKKFDKLTYSQERKRQTSKTDLWSPKG